MAHDPAAASLSPGDDSVKVWGAVVLFTVSIWVKAKYWPVILVSRPLVSHAVAAGPCSLCFSCCLCQERESHCISWYSGKCLLFCFTWCFFLYLKKWRLLDVNFIPSYASLLIHSCHYTTTRAKVALLQGKPPNIDSLPYLLWGFP